MTDPPAPPSDVADRDLVERVAAGDESALDLLYARHGAALYGVILRLGAGDPDAGEALVETFGEAWEEAARFPKGGTTVGAWLTAIARRHALRRKRSPTRRLPSASGRPEAEASAGRSSATDPEADAAAAGRRHAVEDALRRLPLAQREAVELAGLDGLSQAEIADHLDEPLAGVRMRVRVGMERLRALLRVDGAGR